jgi:Tol biopolymer transport system component
MILKAPKRAFLALAVFLAIGWQTPAAGQYFGQNKVQYKVFDFKVLKTAHFDVYFYPQEKQAAELAAQMAERWHARLSKALRHQLSGRQPLILYATSVDFQQTNAIPGDLGEGTGGVTEGVRRRVILPMASSLADTDHVLGHELVHAFQYDIGSPGGPAGLASGGGIERLPLWFIEGMAEYLSVGAVDPNTAMWMRDAVLQDKLPRIKKLDDPKYFPYRWGQALWAYIAGRWGTERVAELLSASAAAGDMDAVFQAQLGMTEEQLSKAWHEALKAAYKPIAAETAKAEDFANLLISSEGFGRDLNIAPVLSPDGNSLLFLSSRSLFSIDLYLADARTGKVRRKVVETASSPHFSSLQFIYSAGAWQLDSKRFVFSGVSRGKPVLVILDVDRAKVEREIEFPDLGEIYNPSWSPDSRFITFSASTGGFTDLFIYDLKTSTTKRMTNDPFADLQPNWAPDGKRIAFVTDRFSTNLDQLKYGNYRIALLDPATGRIESGGGFPEAKHISPQWSADSASIYFISDKNGIPNVYRLDMTTGEIAQSTNVYTGVSGITDSSPALSIAAISNRMAFSLFKDGKYSIYTVDSPRRLSMTSTISAAQAATLPPQQNRDGEGMMALRAVPVTLPSPGSFKEQDYKAKLSLDSVGQPYVAVGADPYGTYAGGGLSFSWSDMLGNYNLVSAFQINSSFSRSFSDIFSDSGAVVAFQNMKHRWNWGAVAEQMPYLTGGFQQVSGEFVDGRPAYVQQTVLYRQTNRSVAGVTAYPLNRAQRVEFSAGFTNLTFSQRVETYAVDATTGQVLIDDRTDQPYGESINMGEASAALVYDTSVFGATSPIAGQRYRLQVTPTAGSIRYTDALIDYRRYVNPAQLYTIAGRLLHYGRYGRDSEDPRLIPLFLGYPNMVRGYDVNSFSAEECGITTTGACPVFDRLLGSRLLVGNLEFRFPLLRPFGLRERVYGPVPVEVAFFGDAGVAWTRDEKPTFAGGTRDFVSSAGVALRVNALGFAILQFNIVRPFQRPGKGWVFQFSLVPGF